MDISALCPSLFKFCRFLQIICEVNKYNKIIVNIRKPQQSYIYIYIYILKNDMKLREIKYYDIIKYNLEVINSQKQM